MVSLMQIGTVFASERYICPNAVGVDIGQQYFVANTSFAQMPLRHSERSLAPTTRKPIFNI